MNRVIVVMGVLVGLVAGCQRPAQPVDPTVRQVALGSDAAYGTLWESSQEELRRHDFELDRVDERAGLITTYPVTSQSFWEFWRRDVATAFDLAEATWRTVRRRAEVNIERDAEGSASVVVTVHKQTFATPERQYNSSAAALRIFGSALPGVAGEPVVTKADDYWIDAGRDGAMEERLLDRILRRAGMP
jgi:hypothetical protein